MRPTGKEGRGPRGQKTQRRRRSWAAGRAERRHERHLETPPKSLWYAKSRSLKWLSWQAFIVPETKTTHFSEITFLCMRNAQLQQPSYKLLTGLQQRRRRRRSCTNPQIYTRGNAEFSVSSRLKEVRPKKLCEWGRSHWRRYPGRWQKSHLWGFFFFIFLHQKWHRIHQDQIHFICPSCLFVLHVSQELLSWSTSHFRLVLPAFLNVLWPGGEAAGSAKSPLGSGGGTQSPGQAEQLVLSNQSGDATAGLNIRFTPRPPPPPSLWAITHGDISVSVSVSVRDDTHLHAGVCEWLVAF